MAQHKPAILSPAGNKASFLAAIAAGADAVYCGLKHFSARMAAENFTLTELKSLVEFAHDQDVQVFIALNTLIKQDELSKAGGLIHALARDVRPDALIVQDLAAIELARQAGFGGEIHLSTLAAVTTEGGVALAAKTKGVDRVVLPRELNIDEIKQVAAGCPDNIGLEVFVHGALCYGVSGRCYWSSYMGGKSGLRGRCVQPCRRLYALGENSGRLFSCLDFSVDVLTKTLLDIPQIVAWKIEGRKKGAHYVYYTTLAYQLLRDYGADPKMKKTALAYLENALGRPTTHYNFLPQRPFAAANTGKQTGSGMLVGRVTGGGKNSAVSPRTKLFQGDRLRIGYEDQPGHHTYKTPKYIPAKGRLHLKLPGGRSPAKGTPVFLIDRLEEALSKKINTLSSVLEKAPAGPAAPVVDKQVTMPRPAGIAGAVREMNVYRAFPGKSDGRRDTGIWLTPSLIKKAGRRDLTCYWWWLPPVIWPAAEDRWRELAALMMKKRAKRFVLNAPWQLSLFPRREFLELWAGPFCNQANAISVDVLKHMGFAGAFISPELSGQDHDLLGRASPLPLGAVISGNWPLCVARMLPENVEEERVFSSPRGEKAWVARRDDCFWVYPNWQLDLRPRQKVLEKRGYRLLAHLIEPLPARVSLKPRPGDWNWEIGLD